MTYIEASDDNKLDNDVDDVKNKQKLLVIKLSLKITKHILMWQAGRQASEVKQERRRKHNTRAVTLDFLPCTRVEL